ncbi:acyltransferase family protein [Paracoccus siganidrum]|uniref:Acyltransferase 3 domain-containing protein n=1 Tax=Paracoccus siganidrum TaxID=1276757 RepID=A0A419A3A5_9RHOB|nr:acyltransferase family protein [Paracoccus siganidrum]RJL07684.1 hypothetical protein D3P05_17335 [Paracoccus siganidrum]RMC38286.1 hypothetical protein C9E82_07505 [Paracoccus siganidrum]
MQARSYSIDYMRLVLAAFVVFGHSGLGQQSIGLMGIILASSVLRTAVPLFCLISGFFLLRSIERGRFTGWVTRMFTLYTVWTFIYFFLMQLWDRPLQQTLYELFMGFRHLWFLLGLGQAALMLMFFRRWGLRVLIWSALAFGLAGLLLQYLRLTGLAPIPLEVFRSGPFDLYPFVVMGYVIASVHRDPDLFCRLRPSNRVLWGMILGGLVLANLEQMFWLGLFRPDMLVEFTAGFWLICPAVFLLALDMKAPAHSLPMAMMASAIYVLHMAFLHIGTQLQLDSPLLPALAGFVVPALCVHALSVSQRGQRLMAQLF